MCWHAVNRALVVAEYVLGKSRPGWARLREAIGADVLAHGWNEHAHAFTGVYGGPQLDAAALCIGLCGLVPPEDPRFIATVECVDRDLRSGPVVYRYREDDGLPGIEGGFQICTYWLVEALAMIGRRKDAEKLFEAAASLAGPTGLLSEEYDPELGISLGNLPQAYSHLGLINAAVRLSS
jgi:GH15 family glucan-1,4-alpha-glucosidase